MNRGNYHRKTRLARAKNARMKKKLIGTFILCLFMIFIFQTAAASGVDKSAQVTLNADEQSMLQEEQMPALTAKASAPEEQQKVVLDEKSGYTVKDFVSDLNKGQYYTLKCDSDGVTEGKYPVKVELSKELTDRLNAGWLGKVYVTASDGSLKVKNKTGEWDGDKFKRYDGTYVENEFVTSKGKTYYFGADGVKTEGWQDINAGKYYFDKSGVMQAGKWMDTDDGKCYLKDDGAMAVGWLELEEDTYYFDQDGRMLTGKQQIGSLKCVFSDDGKLESKESKIDPDKPMMALTFDDGPGDRTGELLDVLMKYDAHATFFMQGINIPGHEQFIPKMIEAGCELGNHSYNHPQLTSLDASGVQSQMGDTDALIKEASGQISTVMRPPYGAINDTAKANVGKPMILWNVDTLDWKTKNTQATIDCVLNTADDGDIVLMHDIHGTSVDAAIQLIPKLIENGYQLVTVSEMAEARGISMENGGVYTDFNK